MWSCWPARDWTSQISYEAVASVVRELYVFEALMCFYTICTKYNAPMPSNNSDSDDDRYDIVGCGAAGQPATGVWTSQISYEAVASVVRELKMCLKR